MGSRDVAGLTGRVGGKLMKVVFPFVGALLGLDFEALNMGSIGI